MIGQLRGKIISKQPPALVIDVNGVGYEVIAPMSTFYSLADVENEIILYTHFVVREDAQQLYGFMDKTERSLFKTLIKVNGVGPKVAISILSSVAPDKFVAAVMDNNTAALIKLPGIGKKTAERLIIEMKDKLKDWSDDIPTTSHSLVDQQAAARATPFNEAISALVSLGYKEQEAQKAVQIIATSEMSSEDMIRQALKSIAEGK